MPARQPSKFLRGEYVRTAGAKFTALRVKLTPGIREAIRCVTRGPSGLNASRGRTCMIAELVAGRARSNLHSTTP